ncbi:hypothetical protein CPB83DRAFT_878986 [Crepidotus variabilis]|uniref:Uncharacterized protein n=1 Tax=Crepidotus variabilis TaxID=179855 RepID=A0A9P6ESK7_9AGAR|nr:hypothetical protein CPB83DRAFT_878986 [Crepidotus variabilis]
MLSNAEVTRPRPPAKARRVTTTINQAKAGPTNTPPPAYTSPFNFPSSRDSYDVRREILGSPMASTYKIMDWESSGLEHSQKGNYETEAMAEPDELEWMSERSKEELQELLLKADGLIKDRENELGRASSVVKNLYENNVALKTKHEALLARIPMSPAVSHSSPDPLLKMSRSSSGGLGYSSSEPTLVQSSNSRMARKVSIAYADLSLLEDQNSELMDKLEQLKEEANSSDLAGRRELKRLEREIFFLREALEKTQAKSEELEEKVKDATAGEASRKKQEREERFRARRGVSRVLRDEDKLIDFAPGGSSFGGPSVGTARQLPPQETLPSTFEHSEHALISQLLEKVKELEATNTKILEQQDQTANQLSAVQRDTLNMSKVYEILAEQDTVDIEMERTTPTKTRVPDDDEFQTIRFRSLKKSIENSLNKEGPYQPDLNHFGKNRKTVLGLFDERVEDEAEDESTLGVIHPRKSSSAGWSEADEHSTWSASLSSTHSLMSPLPGSLSPLHFFSPLSPNQGLPPGPTLMNELESKLGQGSWEISGQAPHLRNSSLYDLSQFSVPSTPSPTSQVPSREAPNDQDFDHPGSGPSSVTPQNKMSNSLQLSVEPPTPERPRDGLGQVVSVPPSFDKIASPRLQLISDTLRSRKNRWDERRLRERRSNDAFSISSPTKNKQIIRARSTRHLRPKPPGFSQSLSDAVENMIDNFQTTSTDDVREIRDDESDADEWDFVDAQSDEDPESTSRAPTPQPRLTSGNALRLDVNANNQPPVKSNDNTNFILQAWLWFQFLIVVFVFLFAMARRGPKAVLAREGGDRRAISGRR